MTSAIMLTVAYGMEIGDEDDPWIALGENAMESVRQTCVPGAYLVDAVPICASLNVNISAIEVQLMSYSEISTRVVPRSGVQSPSS